MAPTQWFFDSWGLLKNNIIGKISYGSGPREVTNLELSKHFFGVVFGELQMRTNDDIIYHILFFIRNFPKRHQNFSFLNVYLIEMFE